MSYNYQTERPKIFTESGTEMLFQIRMNTKELLSLAGAVRFLEATKNVTGDSWTMIACIDYMVEKGEICEIPQGNIWGQHRIFINGR